jgi:hypothetical protein
VIDYWTLTKEYARGDRVQKIDVSGGDLSPYVGRVTATHPGLGCLDVQWPFGNERVFPDDIVKLNPALAPVLPPILLDQSPNTYDTRSASVSTPWRTRELPPRLYVDLARSWHKGAGEVIAYDDLYRGYPNVEDEILRDEVSRFYRFASNTGLLRIKMAAAREGFRNREAAYWVSQNRTYRATALEIKARRPNCPKCAKSMRKATYRMHKGSRVKLFACGKCLYLIDPSSVLGPQGEPHSWFLAMGFRKTANSAVVNPAINWRGWDDVRQKSVSSTRDKRASSQVVLKEYDPDSYLLTHCSIIASVDTEAPIGVKTGRVVEAGQVIDRRYPDYLITAATSKYINNNCDSWERKLLLSSFRTFIGGENYVEHVQIPELSKGKIVDAAARDIGDSIYVDILVATAKKHRPLVAAITSGQLSTLSMGCFLPGTRVTLADGRRVPIEDVAPGEAVLTHRGRSRAVLNKQIRIGSWGVRKLRAVGVPAEIVATDNHPFFVLRPASTCGCGCGQPLLSSDKDPVRRIGKRFKVGHDKRVFNPQNTYSIEELRDRRERLAEIQALRPVEVRADEVRPGDYLCFPRPVVESTGSVSNGRARLLGYFVAEGSFLKRGGEPCEVQFNFALSERGTLAGEVVRLLAEEFPQANPAWLQDRPDRNTCTVHVTGGGVPAWFAEHGGEYASRKYLSTQVMAWSAEVHRHLLGAWLDGDGGRSVGGSKAGLVGTTTSFDLACQMHWLAARCGIFARLECILDGKSVEFAQAVNGEGTVRGLSGRLASFRLAFAGASIKHLVGACGKSTLHDASLKQNLRVLDDYLVFPVKSVEPARYEGAVHDMEVEEDHSYVVEGVAVHNCNVQFTICSQCGNVAEDELQLCRHIKYEKGNAFIDPFGVKRKVAEICGHLAAEPGSVKFIEASWVANPAFPGAVLRSILDPKTADVVENVRNRIQVAFSEPARVDDPNALRKAAALASQRFDRTVRSGDYLVPPPGFPSIGSLRIPRLSGTRATYRVRRAMRLADVAGSQAQGQEDAEFAFEDGQVKPNAEAAPPEPEEKASPLDKAKDDLHDELVEQVTDRVREDIGGADSDRIRNELDENASNQSLIKSAWLDPAWRERAARLSPSDELRGRKLVAGLVLYDKGGWGRVSRSKLFSGIDMLALARAVDRMAKKSSVAGESKIVRAVVATGGPSRYATETDYLAACRRAMGRDLTDHETIQFLFKGRLFNLGR